MQNETDMHTRRGKWK